MNTDIVFEQHRPRLFSLAYRLLGMRSEAEDVVQDAWLRWHASDQAAIHDPEAWLVTATTRIGLDRLRAARTARRHYTGPWLPEPLEIAAEAQDPQALQEQSEEISLALLALLERLGPDERAAFLLKEAFDYDYVRIGELIGHSEANCRQMVHRARQRLRAAQPRFAADRERHRELLAKFMAASQQGDAAAITALLASNARMVSDGGGKVTATVRPLLGAERIARLYWAVARRGLGLNARLGTVNGELAILRLHPDGRLHSATVAVVDEDRIVELLTVMNPDKLAAFSPFDAI